MPTYAIGDVHGCLDALERLLAVLDYDDSSDRLLLTGDLVNRGPDSLGVLRWAVESEDHVSCVLGNHDLHLLARAAGIRPAKKRDTFDDVLNDRDRDRWLGWLVERPLMHREGAWVLVHAGLHPTWSTRAAEKIARDLESELRDDPTALLAGMYERRRDHYTRAVEEEGRDSPCARQAALRAMVSLRTCTPAGRLCAAFTGPAADAPAGCEPWFTLRTRIEEESVIFGHWAALGLHIERGFIGLDTGCVWGGALTAYRLDDGAIFRVPRDE